MSDHRLYLSRYFLLLGVLALIMFQLPAAAAPGSYSHRINDRINVTVVPPSPPPPGYVAPAHPLKRMPGDVIIADVPAFSWCYGCSPTSAGMLMGYYDRHGYPNMYTGPANGGVCPLWNEAYWGYTNDPTDGHVGECPFIASHLGIDGRATRGYVDDYWGEPDPCIANGWTAHTDDCVGDFMGTSQDRYSNVDGGTMFFWYSDGAPLYDYTGNEPTLRDGCHGMRLYAQYCGYTVTTNYTQGLYDATSAPNGYTFADFCAEINAGYPVLIQLSGHTMLGIGYNKTGNVVYVHNTWGNTTDSMTWAGSYSGMQQWGVTVLHLAPTETQLTLSKSVSMYQHRPGRQHFLHAGLREFRRRLGDQCGYLRYPASRNQLCAEQRRQQCEL